MSSDARVALPPGIYSIENPRATVAVICPQGHNTDLTVGPIDKADPAQLWLIAGDGIMHAMTAATDYAVTLSPSFASAPVTRNATAYPWIINVARNDNGTFTGWIMSNDISVMYWGCHDKHVQMEGTKTEWMFVPVDA